MTKDELIALLERAEIVKQELYVSLEKSIKFQEEHLEIEVPKKKRKHRKLSADLKEKD
jgi:hypothetical protein